MMTNVGGDRFPRTEYMVAGDSEKCFEDLTLEGQLESV
jgi:hypothetical protein